MSSSLIARFFERNAFFLKTLPLLTRKAQKTRDRIVSGMSQISRKGLPDVSQLLPEKFIQDAEPVAMNGNV
jgi:hypothetical protein